MVRNLVGGGSDSLRKVLKVFSNPLEYFPKCFATIKATPKVSGYIPEPFEKKFSNRIFDLQKPIFLRWLLYPLKMAFYGAVQNLKAFSR